MRFRWGVAIALLAAAAGAARADDVVFNNFGPGDSWVSGTGWEVRGGGAPGFALRAGMGFTPSKTGTLTKVELAFGAKHRAGDEIAFEIVDLDSHTFSESFYFPSATGESILVGLSTLHPTLVAGAEYWIRLYGLNTGEGLWLLNPGGTTGPVQTSTDPDLWPETTDVQGAFRVSVASVPEPGSLTLLLGAAPVGVWLFRKRAPKN